VTTSSKAGQYDVVIIGAGIIGAACAYRISQAGLSVLLIEKHEAAAMGSTGRSAAGVRVQFVDPVNVELSLHSIREFARFEELYGQDSGYRPVGYLLLVPEETWDQHLAGVEVQRSLGAPVEVLDLSEARRRFCDFSPHGLAGATYGPIDGVVDPNAITHVYLETARRQMTEVRYRSEVTSIRRDSDWWVLATPEFEVTASTVVNAAGAWSGKLAELAGLRVPVEPVRRTIFTTAPVAGRKVTPLTIDASSGFYFRSMGDRLLFGRSNPAEPPGFTTGVDWDWLGPTMEVGVDRFSWFIDEALDPGSSWFGYYAMTPDYAPILGRDPGEPEWVNACGFSGHGVQQAPAVGKVIAEEIVDGRAHSINIDRLRGDRFAAGVTQTRTAGRRLPIWMTLPW